MATCWFVGSSPVSICHISMKKKKKK
jgi:hypothetical protein